MISSNHATIYINRSSKKESEVKRPKPKFSEAEFEKIKSMVHELKEKIDNTFLEESDEMNIAEIKALREGLEKMGFVVAIHCKLDAVSLKLDAKVTLW